MEVGALGEHEVLEDAQVQSLVPLAQQAHAIRDLAPILAEVLVLLDEGVELRPLLRRRDRGSVRKLAGIQVDLALVPRDVDQVVAALAVAVHVARVDERVAVAAARGEHATFGRLEEQPEGRPQLVAPVHRVGARRSDAVPLAELRIAQTG